MSQEIEVLKKVCRKLDQGRIPYMITGSFAANFYAVPRMTRDLDVIIEVQKSDVNTITSLFDQDFYVDRESISDAINYQGMFNIIHNETVFKIDFIIRKGEPYRETEFQRRKQIPIEDTLVWVVSPEDLIISKLYWGKESTSEMQLKDIRNLFQCAKELNKEYIMHWIKELDLVNIYQKVGYDG